MSESFEHQQTPYSWETDMPNIPPKKEKKGWTAGKVVAIALACSLLGGAAGSAATLLINMDIPQALSPSTDSPQEDSTDRTTPNAEQNASGAPTILEGVRQDSILDITKIDTSKVMTAAEVYAANVNSTVGITTSIITTNYWGHQTTSAAAGSGFIFSSNGYILTNFHVVENSSSITVALYDGKSYNAKLIGYDEGNDVAVLKIEASNLTPVVLGNSDNINVGDSVVAIGNPLGELTFSLTSGTISAKDRDITMSNGSTMRLMQTDCAINSGNSGGALFNMYGEVVGITNAKYSSSSASEASIDNIGFAIPINKARSIAESIIEKGYVSKPYIGLSAATVSAEMQSYGLPQGAAVKEVAAGGPAAVGGLKVNDIITHVNGKAITGSSDIAAIVSESKAGDVLKFTVYRRGKTQQVTVTVSEKIQSQ